MVVSVQEEGVLRARALYLKGHEVGFQGHDLFPAIVLAVGDQHVVILQGVVAVLVQLVVVLQGTVEYVEKETVRKA